MRNKYKKMQKCFKKANHIKVNKKKHVQEIGKDNEDKQAKVKTGTIRMR